MAKKHKGGRPKTYKEGQRVTLLMPASLVRKIDRHVKKVKSNRSAVMVTMMKQTALDWGILNGESKDSV